ncbi:Major Facilitator Superfamily [Bifidobacterium sp. DSM 109958]|uniref:Major Facilitator Superfamily n=1 Tax=Bifidobacterium moraviense TaxID=2675323 RepID=A0A7Y0HZW3_9BIFI|nr:MFS transporter [Bifidobacterium sp. DSM 109958]NMN00803.1 Major Facilitator Superfamily [Bifidobacterium sp. DSM 109958]
MTTDHEPAVRESADHEPADHESAPREENADRPAAKPQAPQPQSTQPQPQPRRFVMPGDVYVRPGIDDRPDPDKTLTAEDKAAIARLAVRLPKSSIDPTADQSGTQSTRLVTESAPAVAAATIDAAVPDPQSAFMDMRDPMVAADGTRPGRTDVLRLKLGFVAAAVLGAVPWAGVTGALMPQMLDMIDHASAAAALCVLNALGAVAAYLSRNFFAASSDATHSKFGRRSLWIIAGGLLSGLLMWCIGALYGAASSAVFVVILWCVLQGCYGVLLGPLVSAMSDRVPDKFRASADAWYGTALAVGQMLGGWFGVLFVGDAPLGLAWGAVLLALSGVAAVAIWPREKSSVEMSLPRDATGDAFAALRLRSWAPGFRRVFWSRAFMAAAMGCVTIVTFYIAKFGVFGGAGDDAAASKDAAMLLAWMGVVALVASMAAALASGPLAERMGAWAPTLVAAVLVAAAALLPLVLPNVLGLLLFAGLSGFGFSLFNALGQELVTAVLPDPRDAGRATGTLGAAGMLGTVIGATAAGAALAVGHGGYAWVFVASIALTVVCEAFAISAVGAVRR